MKKDTDESLFTLLETVPHFVDESGEDVKIAETNNTPDNDPDEGLELREEFAKMLEASITYVEAGGKTIPLKEVAESLGIEL